MLLTPTPLSLTMDEGLHSASPTCHFSLSVKLLLALAFLLKAKSHNKMFLLPGRKE